MRLVMTNKNVDSCLVICTPQVMADLEAIARTVVEVAQGQGGEKPVLACFMALEGIGRTFKLLEEAKVPHYRFPEDADRALAEMAKYTAWVNRPRTPVRTFDDVDREAARKVIERARAEGRRFLPEPEAHALLGAYGFPTLKAKFARSEEEAVRAAEEVGYPVVLKVVSPQIIHKFDVGGVQLNLKDEDEVRAAYSSILERARRLTEAQIWGVFVQEFVPGGVETILGLKRDPHFGPLLMFGLGGVYVEVLRDVTFRIAPIRELGAYRMIQQIRAYKLLEGFRGQPPRDVDAIAECLLRLSQLATELEAIEELDINPLMVFERGAGARVVDARILLSSS